MKRRLYEAKVDLELAVIKALDRAPLTVIELQELLALNARDLMVDHDLDYVLAERVVEHAKHETLRLQAQNLQTRIDGVDFGFTSLTRTDPVPNKSTHLTEAKLRRLVRLARGELSRRRRRS